jgi:Sortase domain
MYWSSAGYAPPPASSQSLRARAAQVAGVLLILAGAVVIGLAVSGQAHAPQPARSASGAIGPLGSKNHPYLPRSLPESVDIPAIGVHAKLLRLGLGANGAIRVPPLRTRADEAAWYRDSPAPGQIGASVIEGHVDSYRGPAVFFRLGALRPGDAVDVTLADGTTAVFRVTGVRQYLKSEFPAKVIYRATGYAGLRLITCGGSFDHATRSYRSSTVVFASLTAARRARAGPVPTGGSRE